MAPGQTYAAQGGRIGYAGGGITDLRQGYGLGDLVKGITKPFKKLLRSKAGKLGLMALLGMKVPSMLGAEGWMGKEGAFKALGSKFMKNPVPWITGLSILGAATAEKEKDLYAGRDEKLAKWDKQFAGLGASAEPWYAKVAQGGRIGYDEGKKVLPHRKAALSAMYRNGADEGGLMDLGGMEKDYRNDGGFVPIGGQERADDVPARLSKNEFVFTADAVRAAGGGDIDAGAEVMENVMENLEKGGNISEESQGLEGARDMFATSQRLEGVL
jgi:hypothetical protein